MSPSREHTGFFGVTGTGKSTEVQKRLAGEPRVVVIDVNDEWSQSSTRRKGPMREAMTLAELRAHPEKLFEPSVSLAIVGLDPFDSRHAANAVKTIARLQAAYARSTGTTPPRLLLILDECGRYSSHCADTINGLAEVGGQHLAVTVWCVSQRPVMVPKTVRANLKRLVVFHVAEPSDLEAIEERTHSPGITAEIVALPPTYSAEHEGLHYVEWPTGGAPHVVASAQKPPDLSQQPEGNSARRKFKPGHPPKGATP